MQFAWLARCLSLGCLSGFAILMEISRTTEAWALPQLISTLHKNKFIKGTPFPWSHSQSLLSPAQRMSRSLLFLVFFSPFFFPPLFLTHMPLLSNPTSPPSQPVSCVQKAETKEHGLSPPRTRQSVFIWLHSSDALSKEFLSLPATPFSIILVLKKPEPQERDSAVYLWKGKDF